MKQKKNAAAGIPIEEAEVIIKKVQRTCKGPLVPESEISEHVMAALGEDHDAVVDLFRTRGVDVGLIPDTTDKGALDVLVGAVMAKRLRFGCGHDFNKIVLAGKFDGKMHGYTCPACGLKGTYFAPRFDAPTGSAAAVG